MERPEPNPSARSIEADRPRAVIAVGASTGGLGAFQELVAGIGPDLGLAWVLAQHLDPAHPSLLPELLAKQAAVPIEEVTTATTLRANRIYTLAAGTQLTFEDGVLTPHVAERGSERSRYPIDALFGSLARDQRSAAIVLVLTGSGDDATRGAREVRAYGGVVLVQDPSEAVEPSMPSKVIAAEQADYVLPIAQMVPALERFLRLEHALGTVGEDGGRNDEEEILREMLEILEREGQQDFRFYKLGTLRRRVLRRMALSRSGRDLSDYLERLRADPQEARRLVDDLLIGVTAFFRDADAWEALSELVLAPLCRSRGDDGPVRVWIPGCATGEEAYTVAMLLADCTAEGQARPQIYATDVSERALAAARRGVYGPHIAGDVSPERLARFFLEVSGGYRVTPWLREAVVFAPHDINLDPPFSRLDVIVCRNLLIYLEPNAQRAILERFRFALATGGHLMLGRSESTGRGSDGFESVSKRHRIYRHVGSPKRASGVLSSMPARRRTSVPPPSPPSLEDVARVEALRIVNPALALVRRNHQVVYLSGLVENYLQVHLGEQRGDLSDMARPGLRPALRTVVLSALRTDQAAVTDHVRIERDGVVASVRITARKIVDGASAEELVLVVFEDRPLVTAPADASADSGTAHAVARQLEEELATTRVELSHTIEQLESTNEELRASHEEAMSTNEELQSANEELEASKEELQSLNEELTMVNRQLEDKVRELSAITDDLHNLIHSTRIPTLFLDTWLRIRSFTPEAVELFHIIPSDVGRPITDIVHKFLDDDLSHDAGRVLDELTMVERDVLTHDGQCFLRRVLPYRTQQNRIDGVVVTFIDITSLRRALRELDTQRDSLRLVIDSVPALISYIDLEHRYRLVNRAYMHWFGRRREDAEGRHMRDVLGDEAFERIRPHLEQALANQPVHYEMELPYREGTRYVSVDYVPDVDPQGHVRGVFALVFDRTDARKRERALEVSERRFSMAVDASRAGVFEQSVPHHERTYMSARLSEMLGFRPREIPVHVDFAEWLFDRVHPEHVQAIELAYRAFLTGETPRYFAEARVRHTDGRWIWLRLVADAAERTPEGTVRRVVGMTFDVTDEKLALEERERLLHGLEQANEALLAASRHKDQFLAILAHELRNPLAAIRNAMSLLDEGGAAYLPHAQPVLERQTRHLARLVDDLLDISRVTRGKIDLRKETVDLREIVERAVTDAKPLYRQREHRLELDLPPTPVEAHVDPDRIAQVLANLLTNAAKYTEPGGRVSLHVRAIGDEVQLRVSDNGLGIDPEHQARVFDLFSQLDRTEGNAGLGIGLALVSQLVKLHGGTVAVKSEGRGTGSTFIVRVPRGVAAAKPESASPPISAVPQRDRQVLVVDDNEDAATTLAMLLTNAGYRVDVRHDGPSALDAVAQRQPSVVLLDIGLPGMNGYEVAGTLRRRNFSGRILALSGYGQEQDRRRAAEAGFDGHLLKPVGLDALIAAIET